MNTGRHCFTAYDLFETFNLKQLKIKKEVVAKNYGLNKKQWICVSALVYCFYLIIMDIIENNVTFVLPLFNGRRAQIYAKPYTGDEFKKVKQLGGMREIDIISSGFTGYQITLSWETKRKNRREKPIYLDKGLKALFYEKINSGKQYY